jgi:hypothetical protein
MGTKVRDVVGMGDAFGGSLKKALGCTPASRFSAEYRVLTRDNVVRHVCKQHLENAVREELIRSGHMVVIGHETGVGECHYEPPVPV